MIALALCLMMQVQSDYKFERAVELSVMEFVSNPDYHECLPKIIWTKIDCLGSECSECRETASKKLKKIGSSVVRHLFWAENHKDIEIRLRIRTILKSFSLCEVCGGSGYCRVFKKNGAGDGCKVCQKRDYTHHETSMNQCPPCDSSGYVIYFKELFE